MKRKILYALWLWAWLLCALLGHMQSEDTAQPVALAVLGLASFLPGVFLLTDAVKKGNRKGLLTVRCLSFSSLALTAVVFVANILSVSASEGVGNFLYEVLLFVSSPMACIQIEPLSVFLWACLFSATFVVGKKR